jgi:hypothetical protein
MQTWNLNNKIQSYQSSSRPLKNWAERANFLFLNDRGLCCEFILCWFSCSCVSPLAFAAPCRDTTARTYFTGTSAAIRFRMRTRL